MADRKNDLLFEVLSSLVPVETDGKIGISDRVTDRIVSTSYFSSIHLRGPCNGHLRVNWKSDRNSPSIKT